MTDRALELVVALAINPWMPPGVKETAEKLLTKWEGEDMERAEAMDRPVEQPDLIARLRNPSVQSYSAQKDNQRAAAEEIIAMRKTRDDMTQRLSTTLEQLGIMSARLGRTQQALRDCLPQMGYSNLDDVGLQWEREQGNQQVVAIQRARSVLADVPVVETTWIVDVLKSALKPFAAAAPFYSPRPLRDKVKVTVTVGEIVAARDALTAVDAKEPPKRDETIPPRCETCQHWDNSATLDHTENTGMCRGALPERDKRTGEAVWPFSEDTDSCPSHSPIPSQILPF